MEMAVAEPTHTANLPQLRKRRCVPPVPWLVRYDVVVIGARPIAVLDTIVCGSLQKDGVVQLVAAVADACRAQDCDLVGGEISEQPRVLPAGSYILSAAALGVVDKEKIVDGSAIRPGDVVLAVASNGLHTNGYTLVRSLLDAHPSLGSSEVSGGGAELPRCGS